MAAPPSFLTAVAYSVGQPRPIADLCEREGLSSEALSEYENRGHRIYCDDNRAFTEMCRSSALETLRAAKIAADSLDLVLFASSNADWSASDEIALLNTLHELGIRNGKIIGLQLQNCSGLGCALDVGKSLLHDEKPSEALIILCGRVKNDQSRLGASTGTVFGDGAASCIVSTRPEGFEILSTATQVNPSLATSIFSSRVTRLRFKDLHEAIGQAYRQAGVASSDITALLGTNGNAFYFQLMAEAAGVPTRKIYADDLDRFGHVYSCDNLIALKNYRSANQIHAGDHFLVVGWSPYAVSAIVLRAID